MEMEQYQDSSATFWFQPPAAATNRRRTPPIDPVFLIILIPVLALLFLLFSLPPFLSHASNIILKQGHVKSTWDSLNIFLVLFAILCGLMGRKNDDISSPGDVNSFVAESSDSVQPLGQVMLDGLVRSSSWRQEVLGLNPNSYHFDVDNNLSRNLNSGEQSGRSEEDEDVKEIPVDTFVVTSNTLELQERSSARSYDTKRHSFRSVGKDVKSKVPTNIESYDSNEVRSYPPPPPPPPPPPQPPVEFRVNRSHHKHKTLERKVSDATKEIATAISSLYNQRKRKNKRQTLAPPPPPPLPPPPTVFQSLFKKGGKHKRRIHSVHATVPPPPPPPPPPPRSIFNNVFKSGNKSKRMHLPSTAPAASSIINTLFKNGTKSKCVNASSSPPPPPPLPPPMTPPRYTVPVETNQLERSWSKGKPPLPTKTAGYYERDVFPTSASQSLLLPLPPPPPPFKVSDMKFEVRGDFVKIRSTHSSVCSSPDHDLSSTIMDLDVGDPIGPASGLGSGLVCYPSPDVNAKADSFISRLKDEWRMEKMG